jgi:hypothetical protein
MEKTTVIEMTGSPKDAGFSTKEVFLSQLAPFNFTHGSMTKKENKVDILVCDSPFSGTSKLKMAKELGVEIMTYDGLKEEYALEGDL